MTKIRTPAAIFRDSQSRTSFALMASSIDGNVSQGSTCPAARLPCNGLISDQFVRPTTAVERHTAGGCTYMPEGLMRCDRLIRETGMPPDRNMRLSKRPD